MHRVWAIPMTGFQIFLFSILTTYCLRAYTLCRYVCVLKPASLLDDDVDKVKHTCILYLCVTFAIDPRWRTALRARAYIYICVQDVVNASFEWNVYCCRRFTAPHRHRSRLRWFFIITIYLCQTLSPRFSEIDRLN